MKGNGRRFFDKFIFIGLLAAIAITFMIGPVYAISLADAKKAAMNANLDIRIINEVLVESIATTKSNLASLFPMLKLNGQLGYVDHKPRVKIGPGEFGTFPVTGSIPSSEELVTQGQQGTYQVNVQFKQPLFMGGKMYYAYRSSRGHDEAARWDKAQVIQNTLVAVEQTYLNQLKLEETVRLAKQHHETVKAHMEAMEVKRKMGRVSMNDVLKVRVRVGQAHEAVIRDENDLQVARGMLNKLLNRPFNSVLTVEPVKEPIHLGLDIKDAEKIAVENRPDIKSARAGLKEARYDRKVAEAEYYPHFSFTGEYLRQTEQPAIPDDEWRALVTMDYVVWSWGRSVYNVDAARSVERQKRLKQLFLEHNVSDDVWHAWLGIQESEKRLEVSGESLEQATENLRIVKFGFDNGAKTSTDLLDAEDLYDSISLEYLQAKYDEYFARSLFRYAMGVMKVVEDK